MQTSIKVIMAALLFCIPAVVQAQEISIYDISVKDGDGNDVSLRQYEGQVLLIVNTATRCGFTPQYTELQKLYETYHSRGLEILDFPCNQFGSQAPGSFSDIHSFCTGKFNISFPQFDKVDVNGDNASPLFTLLKSRQAFKGFDQGEPLGRKMHEMMLRRDKDYARSSDIKWNFTKFLVDRKGNVVRRFEPTAKMEDVERALGEAL